MNNDEIALAIIAFALMLFGLASIAHDLMNGTFL